MNSPKFSDTEKTATQRSESVKFAVGVTMSQGLAIPPKTRELYQRYIVGQVDLAQIDATLSEAYPQAPTTDPRYQPGQPTDRYYPDLVTPAEQSLSY